MGFVIFDLLVLATAIAIWVNVRSEDELRGSQPPAGATVPSLDNIAGINPPMSTEVPPTTAARMLVATCMSCRSGDVIGGFLGRMADDDIPEDAQVVAVVWDGNADTWRQQWHIPQRVQLHVAEDEKSAGLVQSRLGVGDSGIAFLADEHGKWMSTFHLGQLDRADVRHDLERIARRP